MSKFKIKSDLSRGFVDLQYLETLENVNGTAHKLNIRAFKMVDFWENQN